MNLSQLPHLIRLLDDESSIVRHEVVKALKELGPGLAGEIGRFSSEISPEGWSVLAPILEIHKRDWLRKVWNSWLTPAGDKERLEKAMALLSRFHAKGTDSDPLPPLLDALAEEFKRKHPGEDELALADFLFKEKRLAGALKSDYYNPLNSSLAYVIEHKRGIPITLACVYILAAARLGLTVEGCNLPGHFLARAESGGRFFYVDGFYGGRLLTEKAVLDLYEGAAIDLKTVLIEPADTKTIVRRVLSNLLHAYEKWGDADNSAFMAELLKQQQDILGEIPDYFPEDPEPPDFAA